MEEGLSRLSINNLIQSDKGPMLMFK